MILSEKSKQHADACRFCWMCHHICPIGNATGLERCTARARALGLSLVSRGAIEPTEIVDNLYECCTCGGCVNVCVTGWDPVAFTKEARLQAALDGILPPAIEALVDNCLSTGNAYGKTELDAGLRAAISRHAAPTDTLLFLGVDARYQAPQQAEHAIRLLESAGVSFTVCEDEPPSGVQLDFLIGAAEETKTQMTAAAALLNRYDTVILYDPVDAKAVRQQYREYGVELTAKAVTYTAFCAGLLEQGALKPAPSGKAVVYQDPYALARDLEETEEPRALISACADLSEFLCNRRETVWAGNLLMAQYLPDVIEKVAAHRIADAERIGATVIVTASVSEYAALRKVKQDKVEILSIEDLLLGETEEC